MPDLKIEIIARDELGSIVALITPDGVVDAKTASAQIARGDARYITGPDSFMRVPVRAIPALGGPYLFANWDGSKRNNLHDLAAVRMLARPSTPPVVERPPLRERMAARWERLMRCLRIPIPGSPRAAACADCAQA